MRGLVICLRFKKNFNEFNNVFNIERTLEKNTIQSIHFVTFIITFLNMECLLIIVHNLS